MSYPELMGDTPLTEAEIQARVQDIVEREWPAWQRERALRLGGPELGLINAFFAALNVDVDAAREHHQALFEAQRLVAEEAAEEIAAIPVADAIEEAPVELTIEPLLS